MLVYELAALAARTIIKLDVHVHCRCCSICERVTPRLAHANSAVVLSAVKVIMKLMEMLDQSADFVTMLVKKLAPPLVTLLSAEPEIQYVALRNINLIVQKRYEQVTS